MNPITLLIRRFLAGFVFRIFPVMGATTGMIGFLAGVALGVFPIASQAQSAGDFTQAERQAFEEVVRDLIARHPEIVGDAMQVVIQRQLEEEEEKARQNNRIHAAALARQGLSLERGNPEGDVLVVEFADYNCGWCKRAHNGVLEAVATDGNVRFLYQEFPVLGEISRFASQAALASGNQDAYGDFNNRLMNRPGRLTESAVLSLAEDMGLDAGRLAADMESPEIEAVLEKSKRIALALGIKGTPAFLIGDRLYRGYLDKDELKAAIAQARAEAVPGDALMP